MLSIKAAAPGSSAAGISEICRRLFAKEEHIVYDVTDFRSNYGYDYT